MSIDPTSLTLEDILDLELGTTGLRKGSGIITEEFLNQLQGRKGYQIYREMRDNEPTINGLLFAIEMSIRETDLDVRPVNAADPDAVAVAQFVASCFDDMSHSWEDTLVEILSMLVYGFAPMEIVYKQRQGHVPGSPGESSAFDDGLIGWRKLAIRSQETLDHWEFDRTGGIKAFVQSDSYGDSGKGQVRIPIEKMLLFRTTQHKSNPEGRSILRGAYRPWFFKRRMEEIEAVGIERDLAGMPVIWAPADLFDANAPADKVKLRQQLLKTARNIRRDEQDGMVFPLEYDENGNKVYDFELMASGGKRQIDTNEIIRRKMAEIALTVLADFILLGHEQVGSFALSKDKTNLFATALDAYLNSIADVFNRHGIPRLMRLNGIPADLTPRVTFAPVRGPSLTELSEFLEQLTGAGAAIFPDERLEDHLRERAGLPARETDDEEMTAEAAERIPTEPRGAETAESLQQALGIDAEDVQRVQEAMRDFDAGAE